MDLRTVLASVSSVVLLWSCASAGDPAEDGVAAYADDPRLGAEVDRICFGRQINGFGETTDRTIIVRAGANEHYLIETIGFCRDLDWAQSIALDRFSSCLTRGDSIIPFDSAFGPDRRDLPAQSCRINAIYDWDEDAEAPAEDAER